MRWADMDLLGHVNNVVYVDYLQEARVDMLRTHGPAAQTGELAEGVVVVRHEVHFLAPLKFRFRPVSIECWVTEIRAASFTLAYEIFHETDDGRRVYLQATTVLTPYVFSTERPRRLTAEEKSALETFLEPQEPSTSPPRTESRHDKLGHYPVHVRFSDVDVYGHVNNVKYFEYFMEARILMTARLWKGIPEGTPEPSMVVAQTDVDYKLPILFRPEPYDAWSWISRVGERSMTIESEICDGDNVLSRARVAMVFFDPATGRATPPPAAYKERLLGVVS
jgi:acyl-CoA thioester hydrolase